MTSETDEVSERDRPSQSAFEILRKGIATTPKLKKGLALTALAAVLSACGQLAIPILIRVAIDRGLQPGQQPPPSVRGYLVFDNRMHHNSCVCTKQAYVFASGRNDRRHTF